MHVVGSERPTAITATTTAETPAPTTPADAPEPGEVAGTGDDGGGLAETLAEVIERLDGPSGYRFVEFVEETMQIPAMGIDIEVTPDAAHPFVLVEVDAAGERHVTMNLGRLAAAEESDPAIAALIRGASMQVWEVGDELILDTTGYQPFADLDPAADLGLFEPGLWTIDLDSLRAIDPDAIEILIAADLPDPALLATSLPDAIGAVAATSGRDGAFTATCRYGDLLAAMGGHIERVATGMAAGVGGTTGADVDALAVFYATWMGNAETTVELDVADGMLRRLSYRTDLSGMFAAALDPDSGLDLVPPDADIAMVVERMFADAEFTIGTTLRFELDPTVEVERPDGTAVDRTDLAIALLRALISP